MRPCLRRHFGKGFRRSTSPKKKTTYVRRREDPEWRTFDAADESFDNAVAIAGIELVDVCKPACTSSGQCWKRVHSVKKPLRFSICSFRFRLMCAPPRRSSSELAMVMISSEGDAGRGLPSATSGRLLAQPHAECTNNLRHGLEARIAVRRERFVKAGSG